MAKYTAEQRKEAAKIIASIGGSKTGASKRRPKAHYKRLADIKKIEKEIREEEGKEPPRQFRILALRAKLLKLKLSGKK